MPVRCALLVATSVYSDPSFAALKAPVADIDAMARLLRAADVGAFDSVETSLNETEAQIRRKIHRLFAERQRDDLLVLYLSGHGVLDENGELQLATTDTERDALSATGLEAAFIRKQMDSSRSRRQIVILDCCHSGAFARVAKGTSVNAGERLGAGGGERPQEQGSGRIVMTATDAVQFAWEGSATLEETDQSLFTHFLVEGLDTGHADEDADGNI